MRAPAGWFTACVLLASCASATTAPGQAQVPAAKVTCDELVPAEDADDFELVDRELIPYSRTLLTVTAEYETPVAHLTVVSGGTLGDAIEAYDDLDADTPIRLDSGIDAQVSSGFFFGDQVMVATWRENEHQLGCRERSVVSIRMTPADFRTTVTELVTRSGTGES